ncbi:hypothetical protein BJ741DRAFT_590538 [Chytriomyces cf. hyalinus JEL632]|nr:hypothetical protein BJ741DRAFT_590538 [Chytriomyces cf. hyalinus JEL632]
MSDAFIQFHKLTVADLEFVLNVNKAIQITAITLIPIIYILLLKGYGRKTILDYGIICICILDTILLPYTFSQTSTSRLGTISSTCSTIGESIHHAVLLGSASAVTSTAVMRLQLFMHPRSDSMREARRRFSDRQSVTTTTSAQANASRRKAGIVWILLNVFKSAVIGAVLPAVYGMVYVDEVGAGARRMDVNVEANYTIIGDYGRDWLLHRRGSMEARVLYQGGVMIPSFSDVENDDTGISLGKLCKLADAPADLMLAMWIMEVIAQIMVVSWFVINYAMRWVHRQSNGAEVVTSWAAQKRGSADATVLESPESGRKTALFKNPLMSSAFSVRSDANQKSQSNLPNVAPLVSVAFTADEVKSPSRVIALHSMGTSNNLISTVQSTPTVATPNNELEVQSTAKDSPNPSQPSNRNSQRSSLVQHTPKRRGSETTYPAYTSTSIPGPTYAITNFNTRASILSRPQPQRGSIIKMSGALAASGIFPGKSAPLTSSNAHDKFHKSSLSLLEYSSDEIRLLSRTNLATVRFSGTSPADQNVPSTFPHGPVCAPGVKTQTGTASRNSITTVLCQSSKTIVSAAAMAHRRCSIERIEDVTPNQTLHSVHTGSPVECPGTFTAHVIDRKNTASNSHDERLSRHPTAAGTASPVAVSQPHYFDDVNYCDMESLVLYIIFATLNIGTWLPWVWMRTYNASKGAFDVDAVNDNDGASGFSLALASIWMPPLREFILFLCVVLRHRGLRVMMRRTEPWKDGVDAEMLRRGRDSVGGKKGTETGSGTDLKTTKLH